MTRLLLHNRKVQTVFDLLGRKENDITYSLGWVLSHCETFADCLMSSVLTPSHCGTAQEIRLQDFGSDGGYTDVEIMSDKAHIIIEAKRGWVLPSLSQMKRYAPRLSRSGDTASAIVVMSECSPEYADANLPDEVDGVPVVHRSWRQVSELAARCTTSGSNADKRLLREFNKYLGGLMTMQNQASNLVYVVSLSYEADWASISPRDLPAKKHVYAHPYGISGWPKEPPNYLGFRYDGQLQSIHHVESYQVVEYLHDHVPEIYPEDKPRAHVLYQLGPAIRPDHPLKTGNVFRSGRVWAALDLLLTCDSISEARDKTKERLSSQNLDIEDAE